MADPSSAIGLKEYGSWALSALALAVTIFWNLNNRRHTNRKAEELRTSTFAYAAWKDLRDPVLARLREFEAKGHEFQALTAGADEFDALKAKIHGVGYALTIAHLALEEDLNRLRSTEVPQDVWLPLANGLLIGSETDWDRISTVIDEAVMKSNADDCRVAIKAIHPLIRSIGKAVGDQIAVENAAHYPVKI